MLRYEPHPKPWTHHHTHRLFHLAIGVCFSLAALAVVGTMTSVWWSAHAGTVTDSHTVGVTATVGSVSPGPGQGVSGSYIPKPTPTANPTITIVAEPVGKVPTKGASYVFKDTKPAFSGNSSVTGGFVFVTVRGPIDINSTAQVNAQGKWYWKSPGELPNGNYTIRVAVFDSVDLTKSGSAEASFIIDAFEPVVVPPAGNSNSNSNSNGNNGSPNIPGIPPQPPTPPGIGQNLFGIFFVVHNNYKYVTAGDKVIGTVTVISNTNEENVDQQIHYQVLSPNKELIMDTVDTISFNKQAYIQKTFFTAPNTAPGDYTIIVSGVNKDLASVASDTFRVLAPATASTSTDVKQGPIVLWSSLLLLWLLFIIPVIFAIRYVRHHTRELQNSL